MSKSDRKMREARQKLRRILRRAEREGWPLGRVARISGASASGNQGSGGAGERAKWVLFALLAVSVSAAASGQWATFSKLWLRWKGGSASGEPCAIAMPDELMRMFRPPASCTMCHGVTAVEKVSNLSPETFEKRFAYTGRPVVVTDGMVNWTAQHVFGFGFFKDLYSKRMDKWKGHGCQFFPYGTEFRDLAEVFRMDEARAELAEGTRPWYVGWSNCDDEINQILRSHYEKPYFLPETAETKKLDWIFMGSPGFGAPLHVDNVEQPSWQAQLRGRKKWSLQPPPECFYECVDVEVVVEPGQIIVLDTNRWYHSTVIVSREVSVTIGAEYD